MGRGKAFTNKQVADLLNNVSAALEIKGANPFRVSAYDRAAASIAHLSSEIKDVWDENKLADIPGVGGSIASHLDELFKTGKSTHFKNELEGLPPAMFEFLKVSGIGPKTAYKLAIKLRISEKKDALKRLKNACKKGKVRRIEGMGKETEKNILEAIEQNNYSKNDSQRMLLFEAEKLADELIAYLKKSEEVIKVDPLGSLRRKVSTVGDVDISVASKNPKKVISWFTKFPKARKTIKSGGNVASILLASGQQIDLYVIESKSYGSLLQHFTGSKQHNIHLRKIAQEKNLSLSEHGIKDKKGKTKHFSDEKSFYNFLKMDYIPPELREDRGEITAASQGKIPKLVKRKDIKGDLHIHSNFDIQTSHDLGKDSFETMIKNAKRLNYQYLGFSEHNPTVSKLNEDEIISLINKKKNIIDKLNNTSSKNLDIKIFNGLEIDIRPNGELAISDKALKILDYAIVSVHSSMRLNKEKMTERVVSGLSHSKVKIFAHPTGRVINYREGYELDWEKIFSVCRKRKIALEINSYPDRLDLSDQLIRQAIENDVLLSINSDSHSVSHMQFIDQGVSTARRGWAGKKNIINCWPTKKLEKFFRS